MVCAPLGGVQRTCTIRCSEPHGPARRRVPAGGAGLADSKEQPWDWAFAACRNASAAGFCRRGKFRIRHAGGNAHPHLFLGHRRTWVIRRGGLGLCDHGGLAGACPAHAVSGQPGRSEGQQEEVPCGNHRHGRGVARGHGRARQRHGVPGYIRVLVGHAQRVAGVLRCVPGRRHRAGSLRRGFVPRLCVGLYRILHPVHRVPGHRAVRQQLRHRAA